jgi:pimeloyl-ACP methyl ester carboxylesterase
MSTAVGEQPSAHLMLRGEGAPLLLLHGWGASGDLWAPVLGPLQEGRRLIVPDLPGFGKTPSPPAVWSVEDYVRWTTALLDRIGVEQCDIVGHSNGGRIAMLTAARHPERVGKLVLVDSAGIRPRHGPRYHARVRSYKALRAAERSWLLPDVLRRAAGRSAGRRGSSDYRAAEGTMRGTLVKLVNEDLTSHLASIRAPALLIWGEIDEETPLADARLMEQLIPDAGLVVFEGAGHFAYLEQPQRFCRIVDVFLRGAPS